MKITLNGKAHYEGKASKKTGKPYNFCTIHYLGRTMGVEGLAALTDNLDGIRYPFESLIVGAQYEVEHDRNGNLIVFEPIGNNNGK